MGLFKSSSKKKEEKELAKAQATAKAAAAALGGKAGDRVVGDSASVHPSSSPTQLLQEEEVESYAFDRPRPPGGAHRRSQSDVDFIDALTKDAPHKDSKRRWGLLSSRSSKPPAPSPAAGSSSSRKAQTPTPQMGNGGAGPPFANVSAEELAKWKASSQGWRSGLEGRQPAEPSRPRHQHSPSVDALRDGRAAVPPNGGLPPGQGLPAGKAWEAAASRGFGNQRGDKVGSWLMSIPSDLSDMADGISRANSVDFTASSDDPKAQAGTSQAATPGTSAERSRKSNLGHEGSSARHASPRGAVPPPDGSHFTGVSREDAATLSLDRAHMRAAKANGLDLELAAPLDGRSKATSMDRLRFSNREEASGSPTAPRGAEGGDERRKSSERRPDAEHLSPSSPLTPGHAPDGPEHLPARRSHLHKLGVPAGARTPEKEDASLDSEILPPPALRGAGSRPKDRHRPSIGGAGDIMVPPGGLTFDTPIFTSENMPSWVAQALASPVAEKRAMGAGAGGGIYNGTNWDDVPAGSMAHTPKKGASAVRKSPEPSPRRLSPRERFLSSSIGSAAPPAPDGAAPFSVAIPALSPRERSHSVMVNHAASGAPPPAAASRRTPRGGHARNASCSILDLDAARMAAPPASPRQGQAVDDINVHLDSPLGQPLLILAEDEVPGGEAGGRAGGEGLGSREHATGEHWGGDSAWVRERMEKEKGDRERELEKEAEKEREREHLEYEERRRMKAQKVLLGQLSNASMVARSGGGAGRQHGVHHQFPQSRSLPSAHFGGEREGSSPLPGAARGQFEETLSVSSSEGRPLHHPSEAHWSGSKSRFRSPPSPSASPPAPTSPEPGASRRSASPPHSRSHSHSHSHSHTPTRSSSSRGAPSKGGARMPRECSSEGEGGGGDGEEVALQASRRGMSSRVRAAARSPSPSVDGDGDGDGLCDDLLDVPAQVSCFGGLGAKLGRSRSQRERERASERRLVASSDTESEAADRAHDTPGLQDHSDSALAGGPAAGLPANAQVTVQDVEDVRREVAIMQRIRGHPNIIHLVEALEDSEAVHLVMELCEGGELFDRIKLRRYYTEEDAAAICRTLVEVLLFCHAQGVVHRDLKPENILLCRRDSDVRIKVIDYGVAAYFKPGHPLKDVAGSPYYLAPEVLRGSYGPEADIWSAGVVLYILLCGLPPFWGPSDDAIFAAIKAGKLNMSGGIWPSVSDEAKELVQGMLTMNPAKRLSSDHILRHPWLAKGAKR
eukprot:jgi/Mesen1/384/ME000010S_10843